MRAAQWSLAAPASLEQLSHLGLTYGVSPVLAQVIHARGLSHAHLNPALELSPNPALHEAAERIITAIRHNKRIRIHGDYDADGVTASSVLMLGLRELGADVHAFIPHRLKEGYGIHPEKVPEHIEACDLFITVDCGVTNLPEIAALLTAGTEVIVTDHHRPGKEFPKCLVVHPHLTPHYHHDIHNLTGAGVAYHLLWAVYHKWGLPAPVQYLDLATIGTVADVAALIGENRALVSAGLEQMQNSIHPSLQSLLKQQKMTKPTARDIGFIVAPRINAAGRMGEAELALEYLTTASPSRAQSLGLYLDTLNDQRKDIQNRMFAEAMTIVDPHAPAIVLTKDTWHAGIMGIVASKLMDVFYKPVFIIADGKGSVRSTPGISAVEGLNYASDLLKRFGGHSGAAGFAIYDHNIPALNDRLQQFVGQYPTPTPRVHLDAFLPKTALKMDFVQSIKTLEPYGEGIPQPKFWVAGELEDSGQMGKAKQHYRFKISGIRGKKWDFPSPFAKGSAVDACVHVERNEFNGIISVEYLAEGLRAKEAMQVLGEQEKIHVERMAVPELLQHLKRHPKAFAVYADDNGRAYLQSHYPQVDLLGPEQIAPNIALMALPPLETLKTWLERCSVTFAWGKHTLSELERSYQHGLDHLMQHPKPEILQELQAPSFLDLPKSNIWHSPTYSRQAAEAYVHSQLAWFYLHLSDAGFSTAVHKIMGIQPS